MLYKKTNAICYETYGKHKNMLCGYNVEVLKRWYKEVTTSLKWKTTLKNIQLIKIRNITRKQEINSKPLTNVKCSYQTLLKVVTDTESIYNCPQGNYINFCRKLKSKPNDCNHV